MFRTNRMFRTMGRSFLIVLLASLCTLAVGQESKSSRSMKSSAKETEATASETTASETTASKSTASKASGRLPRHFAALVDKDQRREIYEIQVSYREQIAKLQQQLDELKVAQMGAIEKVLSATQRKRLAELRETGQKRATRTLSTGKSTETKPASSRSSAKKPLTQKPSASKTTAAKSAAAKSAASP